MKPTVAITPLIEHAQQMRTVLEEVYAGLSRADIDAEGLIHIERASLVDLAGALIDLAFRIEQLAQREGAEQVDNQRVH